MHKSSIFLAIILAGFLSVSAKAQSITDPGVSSHNYKHPNKAAQAKAKGNQSSNSIRVANMNTVESFYKHQNRGGYTITTPKYAPRPATLVVTRTYQIEGIDINPLLSPRNYKTPNNSVIRKNSDVAEYYQTPDSTSYPVID